MRTRSALIVLLLLGLLVATQAHLLARPVEMTNGPCAGLQCGQPCCANVACCAISQQSRNPQPEAPATAGLDFQLATLGLRTFSLLYPFPPAARSFAIRDEPHAGHALPILAVTCIRLI